MALVRKGDASWVRKLRPEHAAQHKAEGGPVGSFGPDTPANRGRIERERNKAMGEFNTSLPPQPPPLPIKTDD